MTASILVQKQMTREEYMAHIKAVRSRLGYQQAPKPVSRELLISSAELEKAKKEKARQELQAEAIRLANLRNQRREAEREERLNARNKARYERLLATSSPEKYQFCLERIEKSKCLSAEAGHFKRRGQSVVFVVMDIVCRYYGVSSERLLGVRRIAPLIKPRHIAMALAREFTDREFVSLPMLGECFAGRDHTTIINAIKNVAKFEAVNPDYSYELSEIRDLIRARIERKDNEPQPAPTTASNRFLHSPSRWVDQTQQAGA